ncbi:MAG: hypothetical protein ACFE9Z_04555 [Promethearchaeota archaeon]
MDKRNKEKILEMIKAVEQKNSEMDDYISNLSILSRNEMLKKITDDIITNNSLLQELISAEEHIISSEELEKNSSDRIIDDFINNIRKDQYKKVIFLRDFLDLFKERISEKDKEVILQSLKDEENFDRLRERMISLANIFKLNL